MMYFTLKLYSGEKKDIYVKTLCKVRLPVKNNFLIKVIHSILNM